MKDLVDQFFESEQNEDNQYIKSLLAWADEIDKWENSEISNDYDVYDANLYDAHYGQKVKKVLEGVTKDLDLAHNGFWALQGIADRLSATVNKYPTRQFFIDKSDELQNILSTLESELLQDSIF